MDTKRLLADWHREDIIAAVRKKKKSMAALSREHGLASGTLSNALTKPWPRGETIIASVIGVPPAEIWPSRYQPKTYNVGNRKKAGQPYLSFKSPFKF
jgi:Ner family transcriptional regulator